MSDDQSSSGTMMDSSITEQEWLRAASKMPRDTPLTCFVCEELCIGIEALREHTCIHMAYYPFKCHHCGLALPLTSRRQFEMHCKREGHRRPYQWTEDYDEDCENNLHTCTGEAVKQWMDAIRRLDECDSNRVTIGEPEMELPPNGDRIFLQGMTYADPSIIDNAGKVLEFTVPTLQSDAATRNHDKLPSSPPSKKEEEDDDVDVDAATRIHEEAHRHTR